MTRQSYHSFQGTYLLAAASASTSVGSCCSACASSLATSLCLLPCRKKTGLRSHASTTVLRMLRTAMTTNSLRRMFRSVSSDLLLQKRRSLTCCNNSVCPSLYLYSCGQTHQKFLKFTMMTSWQPWLLWMMRGMQRSRNSSFVTDLGEFLR